MKKISIVTPVFNEELNIPEIYAVIKKIMEEQCSQYDYEHIFIDNSSTDKSVEILKGLAGIDKKLKIIVNRRNFGGIRSPYHGLLSSTGDAAILIVADFQEPPELIPEFIKKWSEGHEIVLGVKNSTEEKSWFFHVRKLYYKVLNQLSSVRLTENTTAFGIMDRIVLDELRKLDDPYPYLRGLISDLGFEVETIDYVQKPRKHGVTTGNWYILYDWAWLGITSHSKIPLRLAAILGFILSIFSLFVAFGYLIAKFLFWNQFPAGIAPLIISLFFFGSVQLFFIGVLGEYVGSIYTKVEKRPLVYEKERVNFD